MSDYRDSYVGVQLTEPYGTVDGVAVQVAVATENPFSDTLLVLDGDGEDRVIAIGQTELLEALDDFEDAEDGERLHTDEDVFVGRDGDGIEIVAPHKPPGHDQITVDDIDELRAIVETV